MEPIVLTMEGGLIQDIKNQSGVTVEVLDFDLLGSGDCLCDPPLSGENCNKGCERVCRCQMAVDREPHWHTTWLGSNGVAKDGL